MFIHPDDLDKKVKHLLENATKPMPSYEIVDIVDPKREFIIANDISSSVYRLRKRGMDIQVRRGSKGGGYYIPTVVHIPKTKKYATIPRGIARCNPMLIQYPIIPDRILALADTMGIGGTELLNNSYKKRGYRVKRFRTNRRCTWTIIQRMAEYLGVPAELLVDEEYFLYRRGTRSGFPARYAGYKLAFGAVRRGLSIYQLVPTYWVGMNIGKFYDNPDDFPNIQRKLRYVLVGELKLGLSLQDLQWMCQKADITMESLFTPMRKAKSPELEAISESMALMKREDLMFLGAVAHLLVQPEAEDNAVAVREIVKLVRKRQEWSRMMSDVGEKEEKVVAEG